MYAIFIVNCHTNSFTLSKVKQRLKKSFIVISKGLSAIFVITHRNLSVLEIAAAVPRLCYTVFFINDYILGIETSSNALLLSSSFLSRSVENITSFNT